MEEKGSKKNSGVSIKLIGGVSTLIIGLISAFLFGSLFVLSNDFNNVQNSTSEYMAWKQTALDVKDASDYLTDQVRYYVYNKQKIYMDNYFYEANVRKRRDKAIEIIEAQLPNSEAYRGVEDAVRRSRELMEDEYYAMRLVIESEHITMDDTYPIEVQNVTLSDVDLAKSDNEKWALALDYVIGTKYLEDKQYITSKVDFAVSEIDTLMEKDVINATAGLKKILILQQVLIGLNILIIGLSIALIYNSLIRPLSIAVNKLQANEDMEITGVKEYRYLAKVYNEAREQSQHVKEKLVYEAEHDQLTGLFNRAGYDSIYRRAQLDKCYYVLIDIDYFKQVNDDFGHESGDRVIVKVAKAITHAFNKDNEFAFRLGGDEFSVLITRNDEITINEVIRKCQRIAYKLNTDSKDCPKVTLSMGVAKGTEKDTTDSLFKKADIALYNVKNSGKHDISVYEEK